MSIFNSGQVRKFYDDDKEGLEQEGDSCRT